MLGRGSLLLVSLAALWTAAVLAVGVEGNFPLSDDWAYAHVVRSLCSGGGLDLLPWTGATLLAQVLYGWGACKIAGFSYDVLRLTTLAASIAGVGAFYFVLRRLEARETTAVAGAALLAFSPLWFHLSFTFMTDVPFAAFGLVATALYLRGLQAPSRAALVAGSLAAAAAFLIRQHGLWIAMAAGLAALPALQPRDSAPPRPAASRLADGVCAGALPLLVACVWTLWAMLGSDVPQAVQNKVAETSLASGLVLADVAFRSLVTLGFLFLPWAVTARWSEPHERRLFAAAMLALSATAAFAFFHNGATMFYLPNILHPRWIGALTTRDAFFLRMPFEPTASSALLCALTVASVGSAAALLTRLAATTRGLWRADANIRKPRLVLFALLALLLSWLGSLLQAHYYFDRYLMLIFPLAVACCVAGGSQARCGVAFATVLAAMTTFSVAGTHDYMEFHRARWDLLGALEAGGITADEVDGGFEYNAERLAAELGTSPSDAQARPGQAPTVKSWWWVVDDEWIIALGPLDGYVEEERNQYPRWLAPGQGHVLALRRQDAPQARRADDPSKAQSDRPHASGQPQPHGEEQ